jgi:hypothetical protein
VSSCFYDSPLNFVSLVPPHSTAGYTRDFLNSLPELLAVGGDGIIAGDDEESDDDDLSVLADNQEQQDEDPPPEQHQEPDEPDLVEVLSDLVGSIDLVEHNDNTTMKIIVKRINYIPVKGAPLDVPTSIHAVLAVLEPGTQLSTMTASLSNNQQDGEVRAMLAPELNLAERLLPHKRMLRQNASIRNTLALAIQEVLNNEETDNDPFRPRPISTGSFRLSRRGDISGIDGPIDPKHLGLSTDTDGDKFMTHKVSVGNPNGTVPCFVAIFFFLEERTQKVLHSPEFERKLPGYDRSPPGEGGSKKRRTPGGAPFFANLFSWSS